MLLHQGNEWIIKWTLLAYQRAHLQWDQDDDGRDPEQRVAQRYAPDVAHDVGPSVDKLVAWPGQPEQRFDLAAGDCNGGRRGEAHNYGYRHKVNKETWNVFVDDLSWWAGQFDSHVCVFLGNYLPTTRDNTTTLTQIEHAEEEYDNSAEECTEDGIVGTQLHVWLYHQGHNSGGTCGEIVVDQNV